MTNSEFSHQFDTMLNSYAGIALIGEETDRQTIALDEYEKSVFLTKAQEDIVLALYNGKNPYGESFENTEELRRYLSSLVKEVELKPLVNSKGNLLGLSSNSTFFTLPSDLWFITLEQVIADKGKCGKTVLKVYPTKQDEYQSIKDNPFRGANGRRTLRLDLSEGNVEIICKYAVTSYYVRYLHKLSPIILVDLPKGLSLEEESEVTECQVHESLHQRILERAVALALQSKGYSMQRSNNNDN